MQIKKEPTYKYHHDPEQVDGQISLLRIGVKEIEHDGSDDEENKVAHLRGTHFKHFFF